MVWRFVHHTRQTKVWMKMAAEGRKKGDILKIFGAFERAWDFQAQKALVVPLIQVGLIYITAGRSHSGLRLGFGYWLMLIGESGERVKHVRQRWRQGEILYKMCVRSTWVSLQCLFKIHELYGSMGNRRSVNCMAMRRAVCGNAENNEEGQQGRASTAEIII